MYIWLYTIPTKHVHYDTSNRNAKHYKHINSRKITDDIGTTNLGKYTLPIIPALAVNVLDVAETHDAK